MTLRRGFIAVAILAGCSGNPPEVPEVDRYDPVREEAMRDHLESQAQQLIDRDGWPDVQAAILAIQGQELLDAGTPKSIAERCSFARIAAFTLDRTARAALTDDDKDLFAAAMAVQNLARFQKQAKELNCAERPGTKEPVTYPNSMDRPVPSISV